MNASDASGRGPDTETLMRRVMDMIASTRSLPLSSSVKLDNKEEVMELLEEAIQRLPDELRAARWMLKERDEFLDKTEREGEDIVEAARLRAERMVQRTEIVREAQHLSRKLMESAKEEARRLRLEAEDYCDQKLASFEVVLERTIRTVAAGRQKLSATPAVVVSQQGEDFFAAASPNDETLTSQELFFDQDRG